MDHPCRSSGPQKQRRKELRFCLRLEVGGEHEDAKSGEEYLDTARFPSCDAGGWLHPYLQPAQESGWWVPDREQDSSERRTPPLRRTACRQVGEPLDGRHLANSAGRGVYSKCRSCCAGAVLQCSGHEWEHWPGKGWCECDPHSEDGIGRTKQGQVGVRQSSLNGPVRVDPGRRTG